MRRGLAVLLVICASLPACERSAPSAPVVRTWRLPTGGVQPEALSAGGVVHVVYLAGRDSAADVFYLRSTDDGASFSSPLRVNSEPGTAIATGTVRGAQLALGPDGTVHVAWNGSAARRPDAAAAEHTPFWYARLPPSASGFEPQRDLVQQVLELDGGGTLAAGPGGQVLAAWHGRRATDPAGEMSRRVWLRTSRDGGTSFSPEAAVDPAGTGVCGCCALRLAVGTGGTLHLLYRTALDGIHRDVMALTSSDGGRTFASALLDRWDIAACPMTSMDIASGDRVLYAWETDGRVAFRAATDGSIPTMPGGSLDGRARRKHPRLALDAAGRVLMAWTEGTAWAKGGDVAWQLFDAEDRPVPGGAGRAAGLPPWGLAAPVARQDGSWLVLY